MLNLNITTEYLPLTKANIEKELQKKEYNVYDLAAYYVTGFKKFNKSIKSDLRTDDINNSLQVRVQNSKLMISDFGYKKGLSIYGYLNEKYFNGNPSNFMKVLGLIREDFSLTKIEPYNKELKRTKKKPLKHGKIVKDTSLPVKIEVKRTRDENGHIKWSKEDIKYWNSFGISISKLEEKGIYPLDVFWITNNNTDGIRKRFNVKNELCYVYPFFRSKEGFFMYKIYLPNGFRGNKDFKWVSNVNKKVIQNIEHIPKSGELLIIQSSYKDIMLLEELNSSINALAFNGEGMWCSDKYWNELKKNWKHIVFFGNNDFSKKNNPGLRFCRQYADKYKIPFVTTPDSTTSDISDYYKKYGIEKTNQLLRKILTNVNLII